MTYSELKESCIICLSEEPDVIKYDAPCDCKPFIHSDCLGEWFYVNPNTCPICKKNYEGRLLSEETFRPAIFSIWQNWCLLFVMTVLFGLFVYLEYFI